VGSAIKALTVTSIKLARQIDKTVTKSAAPLHWGESILSTSFAQQGVKQDEIQWVRRAGLAADAERGRRGQGR
jgi:hypothetical protein